MKRARPLAVSSKPLCDIGAMPWAIICSLFYFLAKLYCAIIFKIDIETYDCWLFLNILNWNGHCSTLEAQ